MKLFLSTLLVLITAGCGTISNNYRPATVNVTNIPKDHAVIILSTGAAKRCVMTATFLRLSPSESPYPKGAIALFSVDGFEKKSDFSDHQGNLQTLIVPAGSYYLYPWVANPNVIAVKIPKAEFSVSAGEVLYLGEYYMPIACSYSTVSSLRDQQERDMALLTKENSSFAQVSIIKRIATFSGYAFERDK